jgi:hypothetical protein
MQYQWKLGSHVHGKLSPQTVGERLEKIRAGSQLTAETVVEDARPPEAALHPAFEWDDTVAAEEFRKAQARQLIGAVVVAVNSDEPERLIRAFVVVNEAGEDSYEAIAMVMEDANLRQQVLARAMREFQQWQTRYRDYVELAKVFAAASKVKVTV